MSEPTTTRWRLRPGLRVVRRGRDRVQVGLDPDRRVVLSRTPATLALLEALSTCADVPTHPGGERVLARLLERDLLVPASAAAPTRVALRVIGSRPVPGLASQLEAAGLSLTRWEDDADAVLVVSVGEPPREALDPLVRDGTAHLLLRLVDGGATLGPFVQPGVTACLRCLDAEEAVSDPERASVLLRYVAASGRARADGADDLDDLPLLLMTLGWAARDLATFARGTTPSSWSRTLRWHAGDLEPVVTDWLRQPGCGCSWSAWAAIGAGVGSRMTQDGSGTIGA